MKLEPLYQPPTAADQSRPIALLPVVRKVWERCILPHLTETISNGLHIAQGGFRSKRPTIDQITSLQIWIEQQQHLKQEVFMDFLDLKGAYDTVCRDRLWKSFKISLMSMQESSSSLENWQNIPN